MQSAKEKIEFLSKTLKNFSETQKVPIISREKSKKSDKSEAMEVDDINHMNAHQDELFSNKKTSNVSQKPMLKLYDLVNNK
jgi:hypothetical protein